MENLEPRLHRYLRELYPNDEDRLEILLNALRSYRVTNLSQLQDNREALEGEINLTKAEYDDMARGLEGIYTSKEQINTYTSPHNGDDYVITENTEQTMAQIESEVIQPKTSNLDNIYDEDDVTEVRRVNSSFEEEKDLVIDYEPVEPEEDIDAYIQLSHLKDQDIISAIRKAVYNKDTTQVFNSITNLDNSDLKIFLTELETHDNQLYNGLLRTHMLFSQDEDYTKKYKLFAIQLKNGKYDKCASILQEVYSVSPHVGLSMYYHHCGDKKEIANPSLPSKLVAILQSIKDVPNDCQETINDVITLAEGNDLDSGKELLIEIKDLNKDFFLKLIDLIKEVYPDLKETFEKSMKFQSYLASLPDELKASKKVQNFNECLLQGNLQGAHLNLQSLINSELKEAISLVNKVKVHNLFSELDSLLDPSEKIMLVTPETLIQETRTLLTGLSNPQDKESMTQAIESIAMEDKEFYEVLMSNFGEQIKQSGIKVTLPTQTIIQKSNEFIEHVLPMKSKTFIVADFFRVDANMNQRQLESKVMEDFESHQVFDNENLCKLLFFYIKKRIDILEFINKIKRKHHQFKMSRGRLLEYLLLHANDDLRTLIMIATSLYSATPLFSNSLETKKPLVWEDQFVVFEGHQSVLTFKLPERGFKGPKGCTNLINLLMSRGFELHSESYSNYGCIEIQYDYNFADQIYVPVADAHGYLDQESILKLARLFTIFIIHVRNYKKNKQQYDQVIMQLKAREDSPTVVVINHDSEAQNQTINNEKLGNNFHLISVLPLEKLDDSSYKSLHEELNTLLFPDYQALKAKTKEYISDPWKRQSSIKRYISFVEGFDVNSMRAQRTLAQVENFIKVVIENEQDLHSQNFLPFNFFFSVIQDLLIKMHQLRQSDTDLQRQYSLEKDELDQQMKKLKPSPIISNLENIIDDKMFLPAATMIQKHLKGYIGRILEEMNNQRLRKRDMIENLKKTIKPKRENKNSDEEEKKSDTMIDQAKDQVDEEAMKTQQQIEDLFREVNKINNEIDKRSFSLEFVIRELYLLGQAKKSETFNYFNDYIDLAKSQIMAGQPFEIIDGNNLSFISGAYEHMGPEWTDFEVIVVSVIGPQSSGKSLLLNFLFGTQFQSAAGRCTKGVYASLIDVVIDGKRKKILILDTEGIQSAEARDDKFDKRIVFYIICVSHVVLICNKSDMNKDMSEVIRLAADCISTLNETKIKGASIYIIMNMVAEATNAALNECIQKLTTDLNSLDQVNPDQRVNTPFIFSTDNVMVLPWAFQKAADSKKFKANVPSEDFIENLEPLRNKILEKCRLDESQISIIKLSEWFKHADTTWTLTHNLRGLTEYKTLEDKRKEKTLNNRVSMMLKEEFIKTWPQIQAELDTIRKTTIASDVDQQLSLEQCLIKCEHETEKKFLEKQNDANQKFKQIIKLMDAQSLEKNVKPYFIEKIEYHKQNWDKYQREEISKIYNKRAYWVGDSRLNQALKQLMQDQKKYTHDEAVQIFDEEWAKVESEVIEKLSQKTDENKKKAHSDIQVCYKQFLPPNHIQFSEYENESIVRFQSSNYSLESLVDFYQLFKKDMKVFYFHQEIQPSTEGIMRLQGQSRGYIKRVPEVFEKYSRTTVYYWGDLLLKHFNNEQFQADLYDRYRKVQGSFSIMNQSYQSIYDGLDDFLISVNLHLESYQIQMNRNLLIDLLEILRDVCNIKHKKGNKLLTATLSNEQYQTSVRIFIPVFNRDFLRYFYFDKIKKASYLAEPSHAVNQLDVASLQIAATTTAVTASNYSLYSTISQIPQAKEQYNRYVRIPLSNAKAQYQKEVTNMPEIEILGQDVLYTYEAQRIKKSFHHDFEDEKYLVTYFENISKKTSLNHFANSDEGQKTLDYFFKLVDFQKVFRFLEKEVLSKAKVNTEVKESESIKYWVAQIGNYESEERNKINKISEEIVKAVVGEVNAMINLINKDLKAFGIQFSEHGRNFMNLSALTMLKALAEQQYLVENNKPLELLKKSKQDQKNLFIAKLTSDDQATDDQIAKSIVDKSVEYIVEQMKVQIKNQFKIKCEENKQRFAKAQLVNDIENCALNYAEGHQQRGELEFKKDQIIDFFIDPKKFLNGYFQQKWNNILKPELLQLQAQFRSKVSERMQKIQGFFRRMANSFDNEKLTLSILYFVTRETHEKIMSAYTDEHSEVDEVAQKVAANQNITNKEMAKKCASQYILQSMQGIFTLDTVFYVGDEEYVVNQPIHKLPIVQLNDDNKIEPEIYEKIKQVLAVEGISKIYYFLSQCVTHLQNHLNKDWNLDDIELISTNMNSLKSHFMGCEEYCPLCRRQCDTVHDDNENVAERVHSCTKGHQIQGFGGNKQHLDNYAITLTCSDFQSTDQVFYNGRQMDWNSFKSLASDKIWKYEADNQVQLNQNREKNIKIWNHFGKRICEIYQNELPEDQRVEIIFKSATQESYGMNHYILMLDDSGSMSGQQWRDLQAAVKELISKFERASSQVRKYSALSCIIYNSEARIVFKNKKNLEINSSLNSSIEYEGGGTYFGPPLTLAMDIMEENRHGTSQFVLCLMTDGDSCDEPWAEIQRIKDSTISRLVTFKSVFFGTGSAPAVLHEVARRMNGTVETAINLEQLKNAFINLNPNLYRA